MVVVGVVAEEEAIAIGDCVAGEGIAAASASPPCSLGAGDDDVGDATEPGVGELGVGVVDEVDEDMPCASSTFASQMCSTENSSFIGAETSPSLAQSHPWLVEDDVVRHAHALGCRIEDAICLGAVCIPDEDAGMTPII